MSKPTTSEQKAREEAGQRLHAMFALALNTRLADDERGVGIADDWAALPNQDHAAWIETAATLSKEGQEEPRDECPKSRDGAHDFEDHGGGVIKCKVCGQLPLGRLSREDGERLARLADIIGGVHKPCADPDLHEDDARFLRWLADQATLSQPPQDDVEGLRSKLLGDEAKQAAATVWDRAHAEKMARFMESVRPGEVAQPMENSDIAGAALAAAFDAALADLQESDSGGGGDRG